MHKNIVEVGNSSKQLREESDPLKRSLDIENICNILRNSLAFSFLYVPFSKSCFASGEGIVLKVTRIALSVLGCIILWEELARYLYSAAEVQVKSGMSSELIGTYAGVTNQLMSCYIATLMLASLAKNFDEFVTRWRKYEIEYTSSINVKLVARVIKISVAFAVPGLLLIGIVSPVLTFLNRTSDHKSPVFQNDYATYGLDSSTDYSILFTVTLGIAYLLLGSQQFAMCVFFLASCYLLWKEIESVSEKFIKTSQMYTLPTRVMDQRLIRTRKQFECLVQLVDKADQCLSHFVASTIPGTMAVTCFNLYGMVMKNLSDEEGITVTFYMIATNSRLICILAGGVILNSKIHDPLNSLYLTDLSKLSEKAVQEVQMFMARLAGNPIGISVYGFFVIDKSTILMIIGTILTYAIFVLQLKPDGTIPELQRQIRELSNCTCRQLDV